EKSYGEVISSKTTEITIEKKIPILSREQILSEKRKRKLGSLRLGKIVMKKGFPNYDLYQTNCLGHHTIISENLKNALLEEGLTGFELKPFPKFSVEE
ncbi:hypothetical protein, partial [Aquimarina pacifica]|uniref:hypothetical protein n=1 Tax=Aquimarina pacifica TaxID=1296415 RepID=UPI00054E557D